MLRTSLIWSETSPAMILDATDPNGDPFRGIGYEQSYRELFDSLAREPGGTSPLTLPWQDYEYNFFWYYYLEKAHPASLDGRHGWRQLTPFRERLIQGDTSGSGMLAEGYYHPFGVALAITFDAPIDRELADAVDWALEVRTGPVTTKEPDGSTTTGSVQGLSTKLLARLRSNAGLHSVSEYSPGPFSVTTVVHAEGVDPSQPPPENGDIHRALHGLTNWSATWRTEVPKPFSSGVVLDTDHWAEGDALYSSDRSRAVWFPRLAVPGPHADAVRIRKNRNSVRCYHRNLVAAALQVEALACLVRDGAKRLRGNELLRARHSYVLKRAAGLLGRLHGGDPSTYRSRSVQAHIADSGIIPDLDFVRGVMGMPAVVPAAAPTIPDLNPPGEPVSSEPTEPEGGNGG